jgi:histone deacetylase 1/2
MGADSLSGDKLGGFNLTLEGHAECARFVRSFNIPTMLVGGGGYTIKNVSKAWTKETAIMCGIELPEDLPYNRYMEYFGPRYKLEVLPTNVDDHNPPEYIEALKRHIFENLRDLPHAPGVQMREVSSKPLSRVMGISKEDEDDDPDNDLDARIKSEW